MNKIKRLSKGEMVFRVFNYIFLAVLALIMLYPLYYVLIASFSDSNEVLKAGGKLLWIKGFSLEAYKSVIDNPSIYTGYANTLFILVVGTAINMVLTAMGGYFLSRKNVFFGRAITLIIIFTMYFSGGMIPTYFAVKNLGITNTLWAVILPAAINTFNMIIMRTAFESIPDSVEESAKIDGANQITILFKIMLPLTKPTLAVLLLYYGVGHWNGWFNAMIYLRDRELYPLQLILREIVLYNTQTDAAVDKVQIGETVQYATIMITILPIICVYPFMMKLFKSGAVAGAVKG